MVSFNFAWALNLTPTDSDDNPYPKRFLLLGMLLFKDILPILAVDHQASESDHLSPSVLTFSVFTPDFILTALHLLIDKLLPLTSTDLEALEDEPEEWLVAENNDEEAWAFEFRVSPVSPLLVAKLTTPALCRACSYCSEQCVPPPPSRPQAY